MGKERYRGNYNIVISMAEYESLLDTRDTIQEKLKELESKKKEVIEVTREVIGFLRDNWGTEKVGNSTILPFKFETKSFEIAIVKTVTGSEVIYNRKKIHE